MIFLAIVDICAPKPDLSRVVIALVKPLGGWGGRVMGSAISFLINLVVLAMNYI